MRQPLHLFDCGKYWADNNPPRKQEVNQPNDTKKQESRQGRSPNNFPQVASDLGLLPESRPTWKSRLMRTAPQLGELSGGGFPSSAFLQGLPDPLIVSLLGTSEPLLPPLVAK